MAEISAGLLMYCFENGKIKVFLAHPGGPFWKNKDSYGIPKGELDNSFGDKGDLLSTAKREFKEETGMDINFNDKKLIDLGFVSRKNGKKVYVWAFQGTGREKFIKSIDFEMEWPLKSGKFEKFPEIDKAEYMDINEAKKKIHKFQLPLLDKLKDKINFKEEKQKRLL